ncbi:MAG: galactokinase [Bacteroidetes bacterium]|nr:galactokinase [Bacteroidota bacterium]
MMIDNVLTAYKKHFTGNPVIIRSPGRVNLIGEHTDYNDGYVMPAAINYFTWFAVSPADTDQVRIVAMDVDDHIEYDVNDISNLSSAWGNYIKGVTSQFIISNIKIGGFNCVFSGNIPPGAGLSSSAALTCGIAFAVNHIFETGLETWKLAKMAQTAEHRYAKVNCGIMDQFANLFSEKGRFSLLDCRSLDYKKENWQAEGLEILLIDTKIKHALASTEYNIRKQQCEMAVNFIRDVFPEVRSLRDVTLDMIGQCGQVLGETLATKATYIVEENNRVESAFDDLKNGRIAAFGEKMVESHSGLRDKYNVSCKELDFLAETVLEYEGVYGARMMGAGFGGCTLNLLEKGVSEHVIEDISDKYRNTFDAEPEFYTISLENGTCIL